MICWGFSSFLIGHLNMTSPPPAGTAPLWTVLSSRPSLMTKYLEKIQEQLKIFAKNLLYYFRLHTYLARMGKELCLSRSEEGSRSLLVTPCRVMLSGCLQKRPRHIKGSRKYPMPRSKLHWWSIFPPIRRPKMIKMPFNKMKSYSLTWPSNFIPTWLTKPNSN